MPKNLGRAGARLGRYKTCPYNHVVFLSNIELRLNELAYFILRNHIFFEKTLCFCEEKIAFFRKPFTFSNKPRLLFRNRLLCPTNLTLWQEELAFVEQTLPFFARPFILLSKPHLFLPDPSLC